MRNYVTGTAPCGKQWREAEAPRAEPQPHPEIGDRKTFIPGAWYECGAGRLGFGTAGGNEVTGTVVWVNTEHRIYRVRYETGTVALFECFKY